MRHLDASIEALLFAKAEPMSVAELAAHLGKEEKQIQETLSSLHKKFEGRGVRLVRHGQHIALTTAPEVSKVVEEMRKEELTKDLGKAGAETLAIILYSDPLTRADIEYIRGVNSSFILRNLLIRGLIERVPNPRNRRSYLYKPTLALLSFLGITSLEQLPDFDKVKRELDSFVETNKQETHEDRGTSDRGEHSDTISK